jgi:hypothetical protein
LTVIPTSDTVEIEMTSTEQSSPRTERLWAGEIKLTVYVRRELDAPEARTLVESLAKLARQMEEISRAGLPPVCEVESHVR